MPSLGRGTTGRRGGERGSGVGGRAPGRGTGVEARGGPPGRAGDRHRAARGGPRCRSARRAGATGPGRSSGQGRRPGPGGRRAHGPPNGSARPPLSGATGRLARPHPIPAGGAQPYPLASRRGALAGERVAAGRRQARPTIDRARVALRLTPRRGSGCAPATIGESSIAHGRGPGPGQARRPMGANRSRIVNDIAQRKRLRSKHITTLTPLTICTIESACIQHR